MLEHYPEALDPWLEGMESSSGEFRRRVRLAEGFYLALCEAVLKRDPSRGILLWRALRRWLATRFIGHTGIDKLQYAPFAAPDCPAVDAVLKELYALDESQTDEDLIDIVVDAAWPSGEPVGGYREIHDHSWIMGQREAFAAHWLRKFAEADTLEAAHASWLLFMACSDRRARIWMSEDYGQYAVRNGPIEAAKQRFIGQQQYRLKSAMTDNEKSLSQSFSTQKITRALLPWRER